MILEHLFVWEGIMSRSILCIDLKSFFASCECVARGLDTFTTPLVVANPKQGSGAITLAITPYLKKQGIKSRGRLYEIPKNIKYTIVPPRMSLYLEMSKKVINIYLDFVAPEDMHVYSIDEVFLDVTHYLSMYHKTDEQLAEMILNTIYQKTGLTATCGIGPNLLLAKVAMDIEAKKYKNGIAKWNKEDIPTKLWGITPLSKMWGIGKRMEQKLNRLGIYKIKDLACYNKNKLKDKFGVMGEELWDHANGIDESSIQELKNTPIKEKSISHSQVLFKDYDENNIHLIIEEMVDVITSRLRREEKQCALVGFGIKYSKNIGGGFYHSIKLPAPTDLEKDILSACSFLFDHHYEYLPIRQVSIALGRLSKKDSVQLNLFQDLEQIETENKKGLAIDEIKEKYGKNSIIKASSLLPDSTAIERNKKIGGHSA